MLREYCTACMQTLGSVQTVVRYMSRFRVIALRHKGSLSLTMKALHAPPLETWWSRALTLRPIVSLRTFGTVKLNLQQAVWHVPASHSMKTVTLAATSPVAPTSVDEGISMNALKGQVRRLWDFAATQVNGREYKPRWKRTLQS